jgi:putative endonuclease
MFVYVLRSVSRLDRTYVGMAENLDRRLEEHNAGKSSYTSNSMPWKIETYVWFSNPQKAIHFEHYLKSGSGWTFRKKHF